MIRVSIDIDGVIANSFELYKQIAEKEGVTGDFGSSYNGIFKVYTKDNELFGDVLFGKYRENVIKDVKPFDGAVDSFRKFVKNDNLQTYIVTARYKDAREETQRWLQKHGFKGYKDLIFTQNKLDAPTNVIIDDKPKTVKEYQQAVRMGVLVNASYNKSVDGIHHRVNNLNEAYNLILSYI